MSLLPRHASSTTRRQSWTFDVQFPVEKTRAPVDLIVRSTIANPTACPLFQLLPPLRRPRPDEAGPRRMPLRHIIFGLIAFAGVGLGSYVGIPLVDFALTLFRPTTLT